MAIKVSTKYLVIAVFIALCAIFFGGWYVGSQKVKKASNATQNALKDTIEKLTIQINDTEYQLTKTEQELITEKDLRKQDIIDKETLRALNTKHVKEISKLKFRIDTLLEDVNHNGQIISVLDSQIKNQDTNRDTLSRYNAIRLPFSFAKKDKWLDLKGSFDDKGKLGIALKLDSIDVDVISSIDKKNKKNTINILTDCPYIQTIGVRSYKTDVEKPKRYGISLVVGYGICRDGLSPFVGGGLSYSLIRF